MSFFSRFLSKSSKTLNNERSSDFPDNDSVSPKRKRSIFGGSKKGSSPAPNMGFSQRGESRDSRRSSSSAHSSDQNVVFKSRPAPQQHQQQQHEPLDIQKEVSELNQRIAGTNELPTRTRVFDIFSSSQKPSGRDRNSGVENGNAPLKHDNGRENKHSSGGIIDNSNFKSYSAHNIGIISETDQRYSKPIFEQPGQETNSVYQRSNNSDGTSDPKDRRDSSSKQSRSMFNNNQKQRDLSQSTPGNNKAKRSASDVHRKPGNDRSAGFTGYVPRAVSLHDASDILCGQDTPDYFRPRQVQSLDRFNPPPDFKKLFPDEVDDNDNQYDSDEDDGLDNINGDDFLTGTSAKTAAFTQSLPGNKIPPPAAASRSLSVPDNKPRLEKIREQNGDSTDGSSRGRSKTDYGLSTNVYSQILENRKVSTSNDNFSFSVVGDRADRGRSNTHNNSDDWMGVSSPTRRSSDFSSNMTKQSFSSTLENGGQSTEKHSNSSSEYSNTQNKNNKTGDFGDFDIDDLDDSYVTSLLTNFDKLNHEKKIDLIAPVFEGTFNTEGVFY